MYKVYYYNEKMQLLYWKSDPQACFFTLFVFLFESYMFFLEFLVKPFYFSLLEL